MIGPRALITDKINHQQTVIAHCRGLKYTSKFKIYLYLYLPNEPHATDLFLILTWVIKLSHEKDILLAEEPLSEAYL